MNLAKRLDIIYEHLNDNAKEYALNLYVLHLGQN